MDHIPVMLEEAIAALSPKSGGTYVDCTFGAGGYSKSLLERGASKVIAIDQDPSVKKYVAALEKTYNDKIKFYCSNFSKIQEILEGEKVDGIVLDLGVSSMQLDEAHRGFSFMRDGDLDMRMNATGMSASDFINSADEEEIARVIYEYGDERASRKIARFIVEDRKISPITNTIRLAEIVRRAVGYRPGKIDSATKSFQAIRIFINDELGSLTRFLEQAEYLLKDGGKLVVITFHSLEDRIVKQYMKERSNIHEARSKYDTRPIISNKPYNLLVKKSVKPSLVEIKNNPRARSAKLRAVIKTGETLL